jgi:hypothetical protein
MILQSSVQKVRLAMPIHPQLEPTKEPDSRPPAAAPSGLVYDLRSGGACSDGYYAEVARFSNKLLAEIDLRAGAAIDGYGRHVQTILQEAPRSPGEYAIELLTLGQALTRYRPAAEATPQRVLVLLRRLFRLRSGPWSWTKPAADSIRSLLTRLFLVPAFAQKIGCVPSTRPNSLEALPRLIGWLRATGEFQQEAARLDNWQSFLGMLATSEANHWLETAAKLFQWFERQAEDALGAYTSGVPVFLKGEYASRGCREDQLFCGKSRAEYHLSMVAAEVMNRGLRAGFEQTLRKVALVPACMRGAHASTCQAQFAGLDIECRGCNPDCTVNRIARRMSGLGVSVYMVPHSTGFSRWLERWQQRPEVGVTAVACLLNILPGGYEMRARGIASQCVPLDYPGCQKHWCRTAIATGLNEDQLARIFLAGQAPQA